MQGVKGFIFVVKRFIYVSLRHRYDLFLVLLLLTTEAYMSAIHYRS